MHQLRPLRVREPQRAAALLAEIPVPRARGDFPGRFVPQLCAVDSNICLARNLQRFVLAAEVNGIPAPARGLAADRAIIQIERIRVRRLDGEFYAPTVTRSLEFHGDLPEIRRIKTRALAYTLGD